MNLPIKKKLGRRLQIEQFELVAEAVINLCSPQGQRQENLPETWASTRDIAENCDFSIYKTRYFLLKMARLGWVQVTPRPINNALRWYTCPEMPTQRQLSDNE